MYSDVIIVIENMECFYNNNYSDTFVLLGIFFSFLAEIYNYTMLQLKKW